VWCSAKQFTRAHCNYTFQGLEATINEALDSVNVDMIRKYFKKVREYHRACRDIKMEKTLRILQRSDCQDKPAVVDVVVKEQFVEVLSKEVKVWVKGKSMSTPLFMWPVGTPG